MDVRSEDYGELQRLVDSLFAPGVSSSATVGRLDVELRAEILDLAPDLMEVADALAPPPNTRLRLIVPRKKIPTARGWGTADGAVE